MIFKIDGDYYNLTEIFIWPGRIKNKTRTMHPNSTIYISVIKKLGTKKDSIP